MSDVKDDFLGRGDEGHYGVLMRGFADVFAVDFLDSISDSKTTAFRCSATRRNLKKNIQIRINMLEIQFN